MSKKKDTKRFIWYLLLLLLVLILFLGTAILPKSVKDKHKSLLQKGKGIKLKIKDGHRYKIKYMYFYPDGEHFLTGDIFGYVKLWEIGKDLPIKEYKIDFPVISCCASPEGKQILVGALNNEVFIFGVKGNLIKILKKAGSQVGYTYDGKYIVTCGLGTKILLWDAQKLTLMKEIGDKPDYYTAMGVSSKNEVCVGTPDGRVELWSLKGKKIRSYKGPKIWVHSIKFTQDGSYILAGSYTMKSSVKWETIARMERKVKDKVALIEEEEKWDWDDTVFLWKRTKSEPVCRLIHPHGCLWVTFSSDGKFFATSGMNSEIYIRRFPSGKLVKKIFSPHFLYITCITFTKDGNNIIAGCGDGIIRVFDLKKGEIVKKYKRIGALIKSVKFSPDGSFFVSGDTDGYVYMWNLKDCQLSKMITLGRGVVRNISFRGDDNFVISCVGRKVCGWHPKRKLLGPEIFSSYPILAVDITPDGKRLAYGDARGFVCLYDTETKKEIYYVRVHPQPVLCIKFLKDGNIISGSFDRDKDSIKITDQSGRILSSFSNHGRATWDIAFLKGGVKFASTCGNTVRIYDTKRGGSFTLEPVENLVWSLAVDPKGKYVYGCGEDGIIKWNLKTRKVISLHKCPYKVEQIDISPDGKFLLSGGGYYSEIWDANNLNNPLVTFIAFHDGNWLAVRQDGKYTSSNGIYKYIKKIVIGNRSYSYSEFAKKFYTTSLTLKQ